MAKYDLTISVYDVDEKELTHVRNAVLRTVSVDTDISIMSSALPETEEEN